MPPNAIDKAIRILQGASADTVAVVFGRETPCLTKAQMLMQLLRGRANRHPDMAWITDGPILFKKKVFDEGLRYGTVFPIERMPLVWEMKRRGYKMLPAHMNVLHVGEPSSFYDLLKRQWNYGGQAHRNEITLRKKHWRQAAFFLSPLGGLGGIALLPELKHEPALRKNIGFVITMPFLLWIFMFTYYVSLVKSAFKRQVN